MVTLCFRTRLPPLFSNVVVDPLVCAPSSGRSVCATIFAAGFTFGGYGAALWSLMLLLVADLAAEKSWLPSRREAIVAVVVVHLLMLVQVYPMCAAAYGYSAKPHLFIHQVVIYDAMRIALIVLSLLVLLRLYIVLRRTTVNGQRHRSPLYHLLRKLVLYPIVQSVCRLAISPYDMGYHSTITSYPADAPPLQVRRIACGHVCIREY